MPRALLVLATVLALSAGASACGGGDEAPPANEAPGSESAKPAGEQGGGVLTGTLPLLDGSRQDLADYRGKVVLVVNTASECGYAPQFGGLEQLYRERRGDGLVILGFPADDVVGQEPRSDQEIAEFCRANFGVSFPMFAKSNVVDDPINPLYVSLASALGEPTYNFNKYLLDRRGRPVEHFDQTVEPDDPDLTGAIDRLL
jgi:glutathione peroxidase